MQNRFLHTESFRLLAIYASLFVASMLMLGALVYLVIDAAFQEEVMQGSDHDLASIEQGYSTEGLSEAVEIVNQSMAAPGGSDFFLLQKGSTQRLAGNLPPMVPQIGILRLPYPERGGATSKEGHAVLGRGKFLAPGIFVFVGRDLYFANTIEKRIFHPLFWILVVTLALAALGGSLLSRAFLRRMDAITDTCRAIMAGNFGNRIPAKATRNELDVLAAAINEMLDRIASLVEDVRQVSNDIAHDLRTPLTHLRHRLEQARVSARTPEEFSQAVDDAIVLSDRLLAIFSALLRIAQIEGRARRSAFETIDLRALLQDLSDIYRPVSEDSGHPFCVALKSPAIIQGDRELLLQLFANLVENAINHTPAGASINVELTETTGSYVVTVSDTGPGVPAELVPDLFKRFYRVEQSRSAPGYGLGLTLVAAIAELHGANVSVNDNRPGFRVEIVFAEHRGKS